MTMKINPLGPIFAAEITGANLHEPLSAEEVEKVESAMAQYAVVVLRDQAINDDEHIAFSRYFGSLELPPKLGIRKADSLGRIRPELFDVSNLDGKGEIEPEDSAKRQFAKANEIFHTDSSFNTLPTKWSILSARLLPSRGANTEFIDMRAVYAALPEETKERIENLSAEHSVWRSRERAGFAASEEMRQMLPPVTQPLVRTAADGRKSLYVGAHASHIVGWPREEGAAFLEELYEFACQDRFLYRHEWKPADLVIWDNRCTMHRATPYNDMNEKRDMRRTTINESGPDRAGTVTESAA